jgi:hypothetical protein
MVYSRGREGWKAEDGEDEEKMGRERTGRGYKADDMR